MDIAFFVVIAGFGLVGFLRGGAKTSLSFLSSLICIIVSLSLYKYVAGILYETQGFGVWLKASLQKLLDGKVEGLFSDKQMVMDYLTSSGVGGGFLNFVSKMLQGVQFEGDLSFGQVFSGVFSRILIELVAFVLIYFLVKLLLKIFMVVLLGKCCKSSSIKVVDRLFGLGWGVVKGLGIALICYFLILQIANITLNEKLLAILSESTILGGVYNNFMGFIF
ncbi:MAG: CvpA family protein [Clostridia bacterium]|nr:CvpA family protein [Clostridia bacterium]